MRVFKNITVLFLLGVGLLNFSASGALPSNPDLVIWQSLWSYTEQDGTITWDKYPSLYQYCSGDRVFDIDNVSTNEGDHFATAIAFNNHNTADVGTGHGKLENVDALSVKYTGTAGDHYSVSHLSGMVAGSINNECSDEITVERG